jgi:hypothetical protein
MSEVQGREIIFWQEFMEFEEKPEDAQDLPGLRAAN